MTEMYYDEVNICGELFYTNDPKGGWVCMPNAMLTERLEKTQKDLLDATETLEQVQALVRKYTEGGKS